MRRANDGPKISWPAFILAAVSGDYLSLSGIDLALRASTPVVTSETPLTGGVLEFLHFYACVGYSGIGSQLHSLRRSDGT